VSSKTKKNQTNCRCKCHLCIKISIKNKDNCSKYENWWIEIWKHFFFYIVT